MSSNLAKNTLRLTSATIFQKILAFVYFMLIARIVGVEWTGKYFFAISYSMIFSVFVDFGLNPVLIREIAKDKLKLPKFLNNVFSVKIALAVITYAVAALIINLLGYDSLTLCMVYLALAVMLLDSFHLTSYGIFRGIQNLKYEALGVIISEILILGFGISILLIHPSLPLLIIALLLGSLFHIIFTFTLLKKRLNVLPKWEIDFSFLKPVFLISLPFALAGIFIKISSYLDSVLLSLLAGDVFVGWYSVAYKLTYAFQFIPLAFVAGLYPALAAAWVKDHKELVKTFEQALRYMLIISVPICLGIWALADKVVVAFYGAPFANSVLPLEILIFVLFFIFLDFPVGSLLNACDKQVVKTVITGLTMVINVILNIILIPKYNVVGASIAGLTSFAFMFLAGFFYSRKIIKFSLRRIFINIIKVTLSGFAMAAIVLLLKNQFHFAWLIPLGAIIYFAGLFLAKGLNLQDILYLKKLVFKHR